MPPQKPDPEKFTGIKKQEWSKTIRQTVGNAYHQLARALRKGGASIEKTTPMTEAGGLNLIRPQKGRDDASKARRDKIKRLWGPTLIQPTARPEGTIKIQPSAAHPSLPKELPSRQFALPNQQKAAQSDYTILKKIADGGMGSVFVGNQTSLKREVAIKTIKEDYHGDADSEAQFLIEALVMGELQHPNIVPIHELGTNGDGLYFYAMKYVGGDSWETKIQTLPLDENLEILFKVCDAIAFAHSHHILHRDLKPANVMLGKFGEVMVMDWGMASSAIPGEKAELFGNDTTMGGTPAYMAPECAEADAALIGPHTDIYMLGALLYEIIAGVPPRRRENVEEALKAAALNEIDETDDDSELMHIALKALRTKPQDRFPDVEAFKQAIRGYRSHQESLTLSMRAQQHLEGAIERQDYDEFQSAIYSADEAIALWPDNPDAPALLNTSRLQYARAAMERKDYDLAISVLEPLKESPKAKILLNEAKQGQADRERGQAIQRRLRRAAAAAVMVALLVFVIAFIVVSGQRREIEYTSYLSQSRLAEKLLQSHDWVDLEKLLDEFPVKHHSWGYRWFRDILAYRLPEVGSLEKNPQMIRACPDAESLASVYPQGKLQLLHAGKKMEFLLPSAIADLHWTRERNRPVVMIAHGRGITRLDPESGRMELLWAQEEDWGEILCLSPDGSRLLSRREEGYAIVYLQEPVEIREIQMEARDARGRQKPARFMLRAPAHFAAYQFSNDGRTLAVVGKQASSVALIDTEIPALTVQSAPHSEFLAGPYSQFAFDPEDQRFAVLGTGKVIYFMQRDPLHPDVTLPLTSQPVSMALSHDGRKAAVVTEDGQIALYDIEKGAPLWIFRQPDIRPAHVIQSEAEDGWYLVDAEARVYRIQLDQRHLSRRVFANDVPVITLEYWERRNELYFIDQFRNLRAKSLATGEVTRYPVQLDQHSSIEFIRQRGRDKVLVCGIRQVLMIDPETREVRELGKVQDFPVDDLSVFGSGLAFVSRNKLTIFDLDAMQTVNEYVYEKLDLSHVLWTAKDTLFVGTRRKILGRVTISSGEISYLTASSQEHVPNQMILSPDGRSFTSIDKDRTISIRDSKTGELLKILGPHSHTVLDVEFLPDPERLLSVTADGKLHYWDLATRREIFSTKITRGAALELAMSRDGRVIFISSTEADITQWAGWR
jgi:serine/threonine protein kinase/WD40 repeat protein